MRVRSSPTGLFCTDVPVKGANVKIREMWKKVSGGDRRVLAPPAVFRVVIRGDGARCEGSALPFPGTCILRRRYERAIGLVS